MGDPPDKERDGQPPEVPSDKQRQGREFTSERQSKLGTRDRSGDRRRGENNQQSAGRADADDANSDSRDGVSSRADKLKEFRKRQSRQQPDPANEEEPDP